MEDYELIDNAARKRYEFHIDGYVPLIEYIKTKTGTIHLTHTEDPEELEGRGIGGQLVAKVLADIERQGMTVNPLCPFVAAYIRRHPQWKQVVMEGVHV